MREDLRKRSVAVIVSSIVVLITIAFVQRTHDPLASYVEVTSEQLHASNQPGVKLIDETTASPMLNIILPTEEPSPQPPKEATASAVPKLQGNWLDPQSEVLIQAPMGHPTKGEFDDDTNSGNDVQHLAVLHNESTFYGSHVAAEEERSKWIEASLPPHSTEFFESSFARLAPEVKKNASAKCFYYFRNFCVVRGALKLFKRELTRSDTSTGTFRLCNELRGKIQLRYTLEVTPNVLPAPIEVLEETAVDPGTGEGRKRRTYRVAHVTACWQYYGFHLFQCLAAAFAAEAELNVSNVRLYHYNHAQSLPKVSREHYSHAMYLGSSKDWNDPTPDASIAASGFILPSSFWRLWSQNTELPSDVSELRKFPFKEGHTACYRSGIIGQYNHHGLSKEARRGHVVRLREVLGAPSQPGPCGGPYRVLFTYRDRGSGRLQGGRLFENVDSAVERAASLEAPSQRGGTGAGGVKMFQVTKVDWARLSVQEQAALAGKTDILIGMHGAGNSWLALQPPRSVFIELWPDCVSRNVYLAMARQYNIRYYSVCHLQKDSNFMHSNLKVDLNKLESRLRLAFSFLQATRCNTTESASPTN
jgi:hypothetical protein